MPAMLHACSLALLPSLLPSTPRNTTKFVQSGLERGRMRRREGRRVALLKNLKAIALLTQEIILPRRRVAQKMTIPRLHNNERSVFIRVHATSE